MSKIRAKSRDLKRELRTHTSPIEVEFLIVGAGPVSVSAALGIPENRRDGSLIAERSNMVGGTFANIDFYLDTGVRWSQIVGAKTALSEFTYDETLHSAQLAFYLQTAAAGSGVPTLLETEVTRFQVLPADENERSVLVSTTGGLYFKVKHLVFGTGFGDGSTKVTTPAYRELFDRGLRTFKQNPRRLQKVMHSDTFLSTLRLLLEKREKSEVARALPKTIFLFGGGGGSTLVLDTLARLPLPDDFKIIWVGGYESSNEYVTNQADIERSIREIPRLYQGGKIQGVRGNVDDVSLRDDRLFVRVRVGDQIVEVPTSGDMVVDATGYLRPSIADFLDPKDKAGSETGTPAGNLSFRPVFGSADGFENTALGRQLVLNGVPVPVYQIGVSAGPLLDEHERPQRKIQNPSTIHNNAGRAHALIKSLASPRSN